MKNTLLIIITVFSVVLTSCGGEGEKGSTEEIIASNDLAAIRARKKELTDQQKMLAGEIALLDSVIATNTGVKNLPLVTVLKTKIEPFEHYIELQGDVTTRQNVLVYPEVAGVLRKVYVEEGQTVNKGQLLGSIDDGGMSSQLAQMKTQLDLAKTTFERQAKLWEQNIGSEIQYLQSKSTYESQKSAVDQLQSQLDKFNLRAPFAGIVDDLIKDQGTMVAPGGAGSEVFRIVNLSNMYIEVSVPETYVASVVPGKSAEVFFPVLNKTIKSKVRQTGNFINPNNRSFAAEIGVPNSGGAIKPNMTARVMINDYKSEEAILIPQSIISENAEGDQYVFAVSEMDAENVCEVSKTIITTGKTQGALVEVLSGISAGTKIIEEGARSVKDGQSVKVIK